MAKLTIVTREIDAILSAPYVPSLQPLHDVVETVPRYSLQHWTICKPCQGGALAAVLLEGLETWPCCIRLLARWAEIKEVRDAILSREPAILDQLIQSAIADPPHSEAGPLQIHDACIAFLSSPLPSTFILPARVQGFIVSALNDVAQDSSPSAFRAVHNLLTGVQPMLLDLVPGNILEAFLRRCQTILRTKAERSPMNDMFVLAIFAQIRGGFPQNYLCTASGTDPMTPGSPQLRMVLEKANDVFRGKQAFNSLTFVVLDSILYVSANRSCSVDEAVETLRLAREVLEAIPEEKRYNRKEKFSFHIEKLFERVLRSGIEPEIQLVGLPLCHLLVPRAPSAILLQASAQITLSEAVAALDPRDRDALLALTLDDKYASQPHILQPMISDFVRRAIGLCPPLARRMAQPDVLGLRHIGGCLRVLQDAVKGSVAVGKVVAAAAAVEGRVPEWWEWGIPLSEHGSRGHGCVGDAVCVPSAEALVLEITRDVSALVLEAAFVASAEGSASPSQGLYGKFIRRLRLGPGLPESIPFLDPGPSRAVKFARNIRFDPASDNSVEDRGASHEWRTRIQDLIVQSAINGSEEATKAFNSACRDLEDRVQNAEGPLRAKEEELAFLRGEKAALVEKYENDLENLRSEHKERETQLEAQLHSAEQKALDMEQSHHRFTAEHQSQLEEAILGRAIAEAAAIESEREKDRFKDRLEAEMKAIAANLQTAEQIALGLRQEKEQLIAECAAKLETVQAEHQTREEELERQLQLQERTMADLKSEVDHAVTELQFDLSAALSQQETLEREKGSLAAELSSWRTEKDELLTKVSSLAVQNESHSAQVSDLTSAELDIKAQNAALGNEVYEANVRSEELAAQVEALTLDRQGLERADADKGRQVNRLNAALSEQSKELKEVRKLRKKMAGLLGGIQFPEDVEDTSSLTAKSENKYRKSPRFGRKRQTLAIVSGNEVQHPGLGWEREVEAAKGASATGGGLESRASLSGKENELFVRESSMEKADEAFRDAEMVEDDIMSMSSL